MFPTRTVKNTPNSFSADSVTDTQVLYTSPVYWMASDGANIIFGEFGKVIFLADRIASFFDSILDVIFLGSKEQMRWSNAVPNIAFMKDEHSLGDFTPVNSPRRSVGEKKRTRMSPTNSNLAVSIFSKSAFPKPTFIRFFHVIEEAYLNGGSHGANLST
jgi:hypothetical protein